MTKVTPGAPSWLGRGDLRGAGCHAQESACSLSLTVCKGKAGQEASELKSLPPAWSGRVPTGFLGDGPSSA